MAKLKTRKNKTSVEKFLADVEPAQKQAENEGPHPAGDAAATAMIHGQSDPSGTGHPVPRSRAPPLVFG